MTLQHLYSLLYDFKPVILLIMLFAPWVALGICMAVPGKREEPFVLSCNLAMAAVSLLMTIGYMWYLMHSAGMTKIVQQMDILLVLAPCYYVCVSLWVTRQRLPLTQIPAFRAIQGLALISAGYLGLAWLLSRLRIVVFSFLPLHFLVLMVLGLLAVVYMGYRRLTGTDINASNTGPSSRSGSRQGNSSAPPSTPAGASIDDELEALRRDLDNGNS